jgi:thiol-disulfide isomerase/thioredoxin
MRIRLLFTRAAIVAVAASSAISMAIFARAQDEAEPAAAPAQAQTDDQAEAQDDSASEEDEAFTVPEGTPEELLKFVERLLSMAPADASAEGRAAHVERVAMAATTATTRVMESADATPEQAARAAKIKLQMLTFLTRTGAEGAEAQLEAFKIEIKGDERQAVQMVLRPQELLQRLGNWQELDQEGKDAWLNDLAEYLKAVELDAQDRALVALAMRMLGNNLDDKASATELVNRAAPIFEASDNEQIAAVADQLRGALRFMNLEGSRMKIEGMLLSGEPFDWSQYQDKVVLVDFWATWCGPCIRELPNVVENYERYHGKGFEVLGISLDTDAEKVKAFVDEREIPWPILFSHDPDATGWKHPMAAEYGIQAIPAAVLVDKSGTVVTKNARGEALGTHLQKLLGDPLPVDDETPAVASGEEPQKSGG